MKFCLIFAVAALFIVGAIATGAGAGSSSGGKKRKDPPAPIDTNRANKGAKAGDTPGLTAGGSAQGSPGPKTPQSASNANQLDQQRGQPARDRSPTTGGR